MAGIWAVGEAYEQYVGRWSRRVAAAFVPWLGVPDGRRWLDVGCGTGALTTAVLAGANPAEVYGVDPSAGFVAHAPRGRVVVGDARALPFHGGRFDAVVSGLVLNFVPSPAVAVAELARVAVPGGTIGVYVWDYAGGMAMISEFWAAAATLDPAVAASDEGARFPLCQPDPLRALLAGAGLTGVTVEAIEIPTVFADFDDYWTPFLGGQGPAPAYLMSLPEDRRAALRDLLRARLPTEPDGSITLTARAWAAAAKSVASARGRS